MSLILKVLSFKNLPVTGIDAVSIGNDGGSIGRSDDNTLVLPDTEKFVSRHHATINFENGSYYLSDSSLGGVYINGQETPLHNATVRIDNGMLLKVGEYEIAVTITDEPVMDGFSFASEPVTSEPEVFHQADEHWEEMEVTGSNSLMTDNFPKHEELVQTKDNEHPAAFESGLNGNKSPLFDSYIAPDIIPPSSIEEIPDNLSFDDFFSDSDLGTKSASPQNQALNQAEVNHDFENMFDAAITENIQEASAVRKTEGSSPSTIAIKPPVPTHVDKPAATRPETDTRPADSEIKTEPVAVRAGDSQSNKTSLADDALFKAFLQGAVVKSSEIRPEQQTETLHRIGQMFRKLIEGTGAVLRSRAEFKSLFRITMTVMKINENNPFKFMLPDDLLQHLINNKTSGYMDSTVAIEEAFNDLMYHQLAMQAGIQASLTELLKTFDPKIIEKQFEQGIVLQKKARCWDRYEETYRTTVEDAMENFYGDAFVKAYEQQMRELTNQRKK